jgi:nucleoid DNA-binding protein
MCRHTSLTPQEASTALDYFFDSVPKFLKLSFTVGLKGLGHFYTWIRSIGSDISKQATNHKKLVTPSLFSFNAYFTIIKFNLK